MSADIMVLMLKSRRREGSKADSDFLNTLQRNVERKRDAIYADPSSVSDPEAAFARYMKETEWERRKIRVMEQRPLFRRLDHYGIIVPSEYTNPSDPLSETLTGIGVLWARRQISDYRMSRAKDWIAILMPILSLIASTTIAILGLLVALKKK